jgi:hypothetical protein
MPGGAGTIFRLEFPLAPAGVLLPAVTAEKAPAAREAKSDASKELAAQPAAETVRSVARGS